MKSLSIKNTLKVISRHLSTFSLSSKSKHYIKTQTCHYVRQFSEFKKDVDLTINWQIDIDALNQEIELLTGSFDDNVELFESIIHEKQLNQNNDQNSIIHNNDENKSSKILSQQEIFESINDIKLSNTFNKHLTNSKYLIVNILNDSNLNDFQIQLNQNNDNICIALGNDDINAHQLIEAVVNSDCSCMIVCFHEKNIHISTHISNILALCSYKMKIFIVSQYDIDGIVSSSNFVKIIGLNINDGITAALSTIK